MNNNILTKVTYTKIGAVYESYNVEKLRNEISKMYEEFRDHKIKEILSSNEGLLNKYYPEKNEQEEHFPITMINPGQFLEYEIRYSTKDLESIPQIIKELNNEIGKLQSNIINHWQQGLVDIGFLNTP